MVQDAFKCEFWFKIDTFFTKLTCRHPSLGMAGLKDRRMHGLVDRENPFPAQRERNRGEVKVMRELHIVGPRELGCYVMAHTLPAHTQTHGARGSGSGGSRMDPSSANGTS